MRKDRKHKVVDFLEAVKFLGFSIPKKFSACLDLLHHNRIDYSLSSNTEKGTVNVGIYVDEYYLEFKRAEDSYLLYEIYEWQESTIEDKNPLATKIAKVLNSIKDAIKLEPECEEFSFSSGMAPCLLIDGLLNLEVELPVIILNTVQTYYNYDNEPNSTSTNTKINLVPTNGMPVRLDCNSLKNAGIALEGVETISHVIADLTQKTVKVAKDGKFYLVEGINREEVKLKYFPELEPLNPSNHF